MRCSDVEHLLPQYADGALPSSQAERIGSHLATCAACQHEQALLQRSLDALNRAAHAPAPDLWSQFQARLERSVAAEACREVEPLLVEYAEGALEAASSERVRHHLGECAACARAEAAHSRPLRALDQIANERAEVDLWPAFSARLASTVSCREVEERLPSLLAGEAMAGSLAHQAHLASCVRCAASVAAYDQSLRTLSRVAQKSPEVDLWPAFAARLEEHAKPPRNHAGGRGWLAALGASLRGPLLQPALGFAAFALITLAGHWLSQSVSFRIQDSAATQQAAAGARRVVSSEQAADTKPLDIRTEAHPTEPSRVASAAATLPEPVVERVGTSKSHARVANRAVSVEKRAGNPHQSELLAHPAQPGVRVAFNLPASGVGELAASNLVFNPDLAPSSTTADRDGMQAVVQAVELLAGSEDALNSPFDSKANE